MKRMRAREFKNKDNSYIIVNSNSYLTGLKKINIFVGANNSGKSRFLRQIFKGTIDDFVYFDDFNSELDQVYQLLKPKFNDLYYMKDLKSLISSRTGEYPQRFNEFYGKIEAIKSGSSGTGGIWDFDVAHNIKIEMQKLGIYQIIDGNVGSKCKHTYIPILRGVRHLDFVNNLSGKDDVYKKRIENDHGLINGSLNGEIFSGLSIYSDIKKMLLGSREDRQFIRDFENFLSKSFFQSKNITLIPDHDTDVLKINIGDGIDREIFNVGDGIQSIIINTFQAFRYQGDETVLCIEEPEMMMHPSVQRVLIETLVTQFKNIQVFITTHSNHFLDLTYDYPNDVAIYSFEESLEGKFKIKNVDDNARILDLLGIRNSSVFLSNCVIWTEGVTDRMFLRKLINLRKLDYKEDFNYAFAEYGGNNLENFDFVQNNGLDNVRVPSITKTNFLIADNDNIKDTEKNRQNPKFIRRKNIESVLGKNNFFDRHIEIENLIPFRVWLAVLEKLIIDKPDKQIILKKAKENNEEAFNDNLEHKKIGVLLKKYLVEAKESFYPKYLKDDSVRCLGEDKKSIMEYVIAAIDNLEISLSDFPPIAQDLVRQLVEFIEESNKK